MRNIIIVIKRTNQVYFSTKEFEVSNQLHQIHTPEVTLEVSDQLHQIHMPEVALTHQVVAPRHYF